MIGGGRRVGQASLADNFRVARSRCGRASFDLAIAQTKARQIKTPTLREPGEGLGHPQRLRQNTRVNFLSGIIRPRLFQSSETRMEGCATCGVIFG
jgi:hypothetical protein